MQWLFNIFLCIENMKMLLKSFNHENIKILETTYHNNKIKIGHLKGNNFYKIKKLDLLKNKNRRGIFKNCSFGMPNYFGFQRFGIDGENYKKGKQIVEGTLKEKIEI